MVVGYLFYLVAAVVDGVHVLIRKNEVDEVYLAGRAFHIEVGLISLIETWNYGFFLE